MVKPASIFKDHMVVQRGKAIKVFGTGTPGEEIRVSLSESRGNTTVDQDGSWFVSLRPLPAGEGLELSVSCQGETIVIHDVAVGEVWLDGGQSNMELPLRDSENGAEVCQTYRGSRIRFYQVPKCAVMDAAQAEQAEAASWKIADAANVGDLSAVAFYFACQLAERQNCVIGMIDCYWGGTSIACWMSREQLCKLSAGKQVLAEYAALVGDKTDEQYDLEMAEYEKELQDWEKRVAAMQQKHPEATWREVCNVCGRFPWPQPAGWKSPYRPNGLYETMISPIAPYTLRGFLYYQGEEDVQRYACYSDLMQLLVKQWRRDWDDWELPLLFVQLPMFLEEGQEDDKSWAQQRQQQLIASKMIQNTGMVCLADCGEYDNIHPLDKKTPGERLARLAQQMVYEKKGTITPTADQMFAEEESLYLTFNDAEQGLILRDAGRNAFEIAGKDGCFVPAQVTLAADNMLRADNPAVPQPRALRYAWYNYGEAILFTRDGLAVSPFWKQL